MQTVVLGSNSFVGNHLCQRLQELGEPWVGYNHRQFDLLDPEAFAQLASHGFMVRLVVLAAITPDRDKSEGAIAKNIRMMTNLARHLWSYPVHDCVYFSSDAIYSYDRNPIAEDSPVDLQSNYALTKYASEGLLRGVAERTSMRLMVLRPTLIFGPHNPHQSYGINQFLREVRWHGQVEQIGEGEETRDHVYVGDVVEVARRIAQPGTYNVASGVSRTFATVLAEMQEVVPFTIKKRQRVQPVTHRSFDLRRLHRALPEFEPTPFLTAVRETYERG